MTTGVYTLTNKTNNKVYVGQSRHVETRLKIHSSTKIGTYISRAINKHGWENFDVKIIPAFDNIDQCGLNLLECQYIDMHCSLVPYGYNLKEGGHRGTHSLETRQKLSEARIGKAHPHKGVPRSEECKSKISAFNKGRIQSEETRRKKSEKVKGIPRPYRIVPKPLKVILTAEEQKRKNSECHKGQIPWNKGNRLSDEHRKNLSESHKGNKHSEETKQKMKQKKHSDATRQKMSNAQKIRRNTEKQIMEESIK